jgi:hypothetical protein
MSTSDPVVQKIYENVLFPESQSSWMSGGWLIGSQDVPGLGMEG